MVHACGAWLQHACCATLMPRPPRAPCFMGVLLAGRDSRQGLRTRVLNSHTTCERSQAALVVGPEARGRAVLAGLAQLEGVCTVWAASGRQGLW